jgi:predicted phage baseplate assembly protein
MVYRLNRVPEKNYIKFLELLGLQRKAASSARTELTFWLSAPLPLAPNNDQSVLVPAATEIRSDITDEEVLFTTDRTLEIVPPRLVQVRRQHEINKNYYPRLGLETFYPFDAQRPQIGDTFYLGFDPARDLSGHILQLNFTCMPTEAVGIRREDPPWVWEVLGRDGVWQRLEPSTFEGERDTTGGLNNEQGQLVLYLPLTAAPASLYGLDAFWLRCRIEQRSPLQGMYTESPRVSMIEVFSLGATVPAMHSLSVQEEYLGVSSGEPGQSFILQHTPVLSLGSGETLEVEELRDGELVYVPWKQVEDFSHSSRFDRHFLLDTATGTITTGPSVRQPDGVVIQYGRVPENGRRLRFSRYRYGGGVRGNLPVGSISTMTSSLAYVARVSNLVRAAGGRDQETMDELKLRAQRELQAQRRAVTAQDYEQFTYNASRSVARARCLTPKDDPDCGPGNVSILVVPAAADGLSSGSLASLHVDDHLRSQIQKHLDAYRLLTASLHIREPRYQGVKVKARIIPDDFVQPAEVQRRVSEELRRYLSPLPLDGEKPLLAAGENWDGWSFGRDLFTAEVVSLIQQVPLVKYVLDVEVAFRPVVPVEERELFEDRPEPELVPVNRVLKVPPDGLICSLDHEIETVSVEDMYR